MTVETGMPSAAGERTNPLFFGRANAKFFGQKPAAKMKKNSLAR